jgi:hypothetical protein
MATSMIATQPMEKPGRLLLAIMAWQRELAAKQQ